MDFKQFSLTNIWIHSIHILLSKYSQSVRAWEWSYMLCLSKEIWWKNAQECYQHLSIEVLSQRLSPKPDYFSLDFSNLLICNANTLDIDMNDEWQENQEKHPNKNIWSKTTCNPKGNYHLHILLSTMFLHKNHSAAMEDKVKIFVWEKDYRHNHSKICF